LRIDSTVQPELLTVQADHFLVNRELILSHHRERLKIGLVNPFVKRYMTPFDTQLIEKLAGIPQ
jgi:hypothetical protein